MPTKITPEEIRKFKTFSGKEVLTVDEWKSEEIGTFLVDEDGARSVVSAASELIKHADEVIAILSYKERGRPAGKKDSKPRKAKTVAIGNSATGTVP